jgi:hypothetical protein
VRGRSAVALCALLTGADDAGHDGRANWAGAAAAAAPGYAGIGREARRMAIGVTAADEEGSSLPWTSSSNAANS